MVSLVPTKEIGYNVLTPPMKKENNMHVLSERQEMIIQALNNREFLMKPITQDKFNELLDEFGEDQLARELDYLQKRGLVQDGAVRIGVVDDEAYSFNIHKMGLTADGVDCANADTLGNKLNVVNIKIHESTINNLEAMIRAVNLPDEDKKTLLDMVKEKGAEAVVSRMVDYAFANASIATKLFLEATKTKLGFHD